MKMVKKLISLCNRTLEFGLIGLAVFAPIAFGAVHVWAYSAVEFTVLLLIAVWLIKSLLAWKFFHSRGNSNLIGEEEKEKIGVGNKNSLSKTINSPFLSKILVIPIALFFVLILFQMVPIPQPYLKQISPKTHTIYQLMPEELLNEMQNSLLEKPIKFKKWPFAHSYRTLSLNNHSSNEIVLKIFCFVTVFFIIISNFSYSQQFQSSNHYDSLVKIDNELIQFKIPVQRLLWGILATGCAISILALLQYLTGTLKIFWIRDASYANPFGTYINRNHFAGYINMIIPLSLAIFISRQKMDRNIRENRRKNLVHSLKHFLLSLQPWIQKNGIYTLSAILMVSSLFLSSSRGGVASFFFSFLFFLALCVIGKHQHPSVFPLFKTLIVLGGLFFIVALWTNLDPLLGRIGWVAEDFDRFLGYGRIRANLAAITMADNFFWFGIGLGAFSEVYFQYRGQEIAESWYKEAHNDYLQLFAETGIIGLVLVILLIVMFYTITFFSYNKQTNVNVRILGAGGLSGMTTMVVHSLVDFNMQIPANALIFSMVSAITWVIVTSPISSNVNSDRERNERVRVRKVRKRVRK